jgi:rSAM/selenodomain-associated transferase 2
MRISAIIPVLNEENSIASVLRALKHLGADQVIVVDGGSTDRTREICEQAEVDLLVSPRGRARQMNQGARNATGEVLLFLHADTRLPASGLEDVRSALRDSRTMGGRFDVRLDDDRRIFKIIGNMINLRSRLTKMATGDQAIFVRREVFEKLGGFPDLPLMEDIAFSRMLKKRGRIACLRSRVVTSARRWETGGVWRTIFKMWILRLLYLAKVSPFRLKRFYDDAR